MSRKKQIHYTLDPGDIQSLSKDEIHTILRAADHIIASGGRSLLAKILKGSKDKKLLNLELDDVPVYAAFAELTLKEITHRIDWAILNRYLRIEYFEKLPLIVFTPQAWDIVRDIRSSELLRDFEIKFLTEEPPYDMEYLKDRNREMILELLDKTEASKDIRFIPLLEDWAKIDYKKIKKRIKEVIKEIRASQ